MFPGRRWTEQRVTMFFVAKSENGGDNCFPEDTRFSILTSLARTCPHRRHATHLVENKIRANLVNEGWKAFGKKGKILIVLGALVHLDVNVGFLPAGCECGCRGDRGSGSGIGMGIGSGSRSGVVRTCITVTRGLEDFNGRSSGRIET